MCNFDIESFYTNIPVSDTIDIIINRLFTQGSDNLNGFTKREFIIIFEPCFKHFYIKFNNKIYQQLDGLAGWTYISFSSKYFP